MNIVDSSMFVKELLNNALLHSTPRFGTWLQQRPDADDDVFANHICPDRIRRLTVYESYLDIAGEREGGMLAVVGDLGKKDRSMLGAYN